MSEHKLKNAADAVQSYLNGLQSKTRQAPRLGKPTTESPEYVDAPGRLAVTLLSLLHRRRSMVAQRNELKYPCLSSAQ